MFPAEALAHELKARGYSIILATDERADRIFSKVQDGIITSLSCGYRRFKIEQEDTKNPPVWRVTDWEPFEISFVLVPADPNTGKRSGETDDAALFRNETVIGAAPIQRSNGLASIRMRARRRIVSRN